MSAMEVILSFLSSIRELAKAITVPGFSFTFWDVGVGSFMVCAGITFTKFLMGAHVIDTPNSSESVGVKKI